MKRVLFLLLLFMSYLPSWSKNANQLNEFIVASLKSYISHNEDFRERVGWEHNGFYYICKDGLPDDFPYENILNVRFFSINKYERESYKRSFKNTLNKGIAALFVSYRLNGNELRIQITVKLVTLHKKWVSMGLIGWGIYTYEYSCESNKWELKETKYGGV